MKRPNFFVVGAPKCGTTAMYEYLREHPEVFLPRRKELHYFGSDIRSPVFADSLERYLSFYEDADDEKRVGDIAIWYLYSKTAAKEIKEFAPDAKIIAMLRNPVDMIYSYHSQRLYNQNEDIQDFEEALAAEADRRQGRRMPAKSDPVHGLFYRELPMYGEQLQRYIDQFGRDNLLVILYDDLKADTRAVYARTVAFLELDPAFEPEFTVVNPNRRVRSQWFQDFVRNPPGPLHWVARHLMDPERRRNLRRRFLTFNAKFEQRPPLPERVRKDLNAFYRPDVERVGRMLDRDLVTLWGMQ